MSEELEKAIKRLEEDISIGECSTTKTEVLETVLQALKNSIPKEKVREAIENIENYFDRLNGPNEDIEFIREVKQELLEENK